MQHKLDTTALQPGRRLPGGFFFTPGVRGLRVRRVARAASTGQAHRHRGNGARRSADIALFRTQFGLPRFTLERVGTRRRTSARDFTGALDVTWSGAVAPGAAVVLSINRERSSTRSAPRGDISVINSS
jgi:hypothetical protein